MRAPRLAAAFFLSAFAFFALRLLAEALVLEPHYRQLIEAGLLKGPPRFLGLPLSLWMDLPAALVVVAVVSLFGKSRLVAALSAAPVSALLAHAGEASLKDLPDIIPVTWAACAVLGALLAAFLAGRIAPPPQAPADSLLAPSP